MSGARRRRGPGVGRTGGAAGRAWRVAARRSRARRLGVGRRARGSGRARRLPQPRQWWPRPRPGCEPAPRFASLRAGPAPAAPGLPPPARARWGARGAAPEARPHCDVVGPRQRLHRPPAPAAAVPAPAAAVYPSVRPSVRALEPPQRGAPPVSPGPPRAPRGSWGRRRGRLSLSKFAPGDPSGYRPGSPRAPGPLCAASPSCSSCGGASAERVRGEVSIVTAAVAAKRLVSLEEGGTTLSSISKELFFSFARFLWLLFLLPPRIAWEAGMGSAAALRAEITRGRSTSNINSTNSNNSNSKTGTPGDAMAQGEPLLVRLLPRPPGCPVLPRLRPPPSGAVLRPRAPPRQF